MPDLLTEVPDKPFELRYNPSDWVKSELKYFSELRRSMNYLAAHPQTFFMGQSITTPQGNMMYSTLLEVPKDKIIELPVTEDFQLGMSTGMAANGFIPISTYRCWNFFLLAMNQLVNHLDKFNEITNGEFQPKVIIRVGIGGVRPLNQGPQHSGDHTEAVRMLLTNIEIIRMDEPEQIFPAYQKALEREDGKSTVLVEWLDYYAEK
jgi:pyruvate/2-oxoglutarate/acetoin dehydrogenase E1 component